MLCAAAGNTVMGLKWLVLGVMLVMSAVGNDAFDMTITPKRASTKPGKSVGLMCNLSVPVEDCAFNVWQVFYNGTKRENGKIIQLGKGHNSGHFYQPEDGPRLFEAQYHGTGLENGQCGLRMTGLTPGLYFVGCRVRTASSSWTYDHMALVVHYGAAIESSETDIEMVMFEKTKNEPISFNVNASPGQCHIYLPDTNVPVELNKGSIWALADKKYAAVWNMQDKTINVTLRDVTSGGVVWCLCRSKNNNENIEMYMKIVTVLKPPSSPELEVPRTNFTSGESLTATCVAKYARPVAKIVWKLGDDVIRNDTVDDNADDARMDVDPNDENEPKGDWPWRWPWSTKSIKQVLHYPRLTLEDNGKDLTCQVSHPALANGHWVSSNTTIIVNPAFSYPSTMGLESMTNELLNHGGLDSSTLSVILDSITLQIIMAATVGVVLLAVIIGAAIFCQRRKRAAFPPAEAGPSDRTSFVVDNDLYQSHAEARFVNAQAPGLQRVYETENPYEEVHFAPTVSHPPVAPSARQSAIYGNTVQYLEVTIGPSAGSKPPPRKPVVPETCVYAEVMHKDRPKR